MGIAGRPSETGSRGVRSDRNRLDTRAGSIVRQEKTGNVNFPGGFVRFRLGLYWVLFCFFFFFNVVSLRQVPTLSPWLF